MACLVLSHSGQAWSKLESEWSSMLQQSMSRSAREDCRRASEAMRPPPAASYPRADDAAADDDNVRDARRGDSSTCAIISPSRKESGSEIFAGK